jgi:hypothetical protein
VSSYLARPERALIDAAVDRIYDLLPLPTHRAVRPDRRDPRRPSRQRSRAGAGMTATTSDTGTALAETQEERLTRLEAEVAELRAMAERLVMALGRGVQQQSTPLG